eukprot:TRINITY_DN64731_c0_g1_i1.p1 TRINITY_DN64731_c0_g1~~TRINITY_DN64731_c0_g1_i1.p1  ORF type:complete len:284 (+),score=36.39 TRINITY_DN64731_c0_g1_i1:158-1009(+)
MTSKLFLGGVPPGTTEDDIRNYFDRFGNIVDAVVIRERGFGFVTFDDESSARAVMGEHHVLNGQSISVKEAVGKGCCGKGAGGSAGMGKGGPTEGPPTNKIFIGGLPQDCSEEKVSAYFELYGTIVDCVVMKDRNTGRARGFGFVQYDSPDSVEKVMAEYSTHKIDGKWVECKRSIPKEQMDVGPSSSRASSAGCYGKGGAYPGPYGGYAAYGPAAYGGYGGPGGYGGCYGGYGGGCYGGGCYGGPYGGPYGGGGYAAYGGGGYAPSPYGPGYPSKGGRAAPY